MKRSQANRSVIAARATVLRPSTPNNVAMLRPHTARITTGPVRRTTAAPLTRMQRNSEGRPSEWAASPYFFTDPRWSQTVGNQNVGR